jgi:hypothetical protein
MALLRILLRETVGRLVGADDARRLFDVFDGRHSPVARVLFSPRVTVRLEGNGRRPAPAAVIQKQHTPTIARPLQRDERQQGWGVWTERRQGRPGVGSTPDRIKAPRALVQAALRGARMTTVALGLVLEAAVSGGPAFVWLFLALATLLNALSRQR